MCFTNCCFVAKFLPQQGHLADGSLYLSCGKDAQLDEITNHMKKSSQDGILISWLRRVFFLFFFGWSYVTSTWAKSKSQATGTSWCFMNSTNLFATFVKRCSLRKNISSFFGVHHGFQTPWVWRYDWTPKTYLKHQTSGGSWKPRVIHNSTHFARFFQRNQ